MRIFDRFIDKFRGALIPFILIGVVVVMLVGGLFKTITDFIVKYKTETILFFGTGAFVIPIIIAIVTDWELPGILLLYDFLFGIGILIMLSASVDDKYYEQEGGYNGCRGYQSPSNINKTYGYNTYFSPLNREKERNGGFTDKEVTLKKQMIRKKLEKNNLLDRTTNEKEKVTTNE